MHKKNIDSLFVNDLNVAVGDSSVDIKWTYAGNAGWNEKHAMWDFRSVSRVLFKAGNHICERINNYRKDKNQIHQVNFGKYKY